jgi:hypothetical protein
VFGEEYKLRNSSLGLIFIIHLSVRHDRASVWDNIAFPFAQLVGWNWLDDLNSIPCRSSFFCLFAIRLWSPPISYRGWGVKLTIRYHAVPRLRNLFPLFMAWCLGTVLTYEDGCHLGYCAVSSVSTRLRPEEAIRRRESLKSHLGTASFYPFCVMSWHLVTGPADAWQRVVSAMSLLQTCITPDHFAYRGRLLWETHAQSPCRTPQIAGLFIISVFPC